MKNGETERRKKEREEKERKMKPRMDGRKEIKK